MSKVWYDVTVTILLEDSQDAVESLMDRVADAICDHETSGDYNCCPYNYVISARPCAEDEDEEDVA